MVESLMWDDMFRKISQTDIEKSKVNKLVVPVIWKYTPDISQAITEALWLKYNKLFPNVWIGTAFKGKLVSE